MLDLSLLSRSRILLVRQTEIAECGLASLAMIANYYGFDVDLVTLRRRFAPSLRGAPLRALMQTADSLGLSSRAVKLPLTALSKLRCPCILHWDMNHYVVLERVTGNQALIHDPAGSSDWFALDEVSHHFTGVALELEPSHDFRPQRSRERLALSQLWERLTGVKRALLQVFVLTLVMQAFVLSLPYFTQTAIDKALPAQDQDLLAVLAMGFGLFMFINAVATLIRSFVLLVTGATLGFGLAANLARRLFRLPIVWFEKRNIGDVLSRFQSITPIQTMLTENAAASVVDGVMAVFCLGIMLLYNLPLTLITFTAFCLYLIVRLVTFAAERRAKEETIIAHGKEQTTMIESLRGVTTLRLFGKEASRNRLWQHRLTEAVNADVRHARIGIWQNSANALIFGAENILVIWLAVSLVIEGAGFSVGMVFAFMAYKTLFIRNASSLIDQGAEFKMLGLHLERLSDIALATEDHGFQDTEQRETSCKGRLELRDVHYRYAPTEPAVLDGVDLTVESGEHVVITGTSGGGKSTLIKIMLGLLEPDDGNLLIDGLELDRFGRRSFHEQVAAVMQEDSLFTGTIADNISFFDDRLDMHRVILSARAASIHDEIGLMPMQYETLVGDMGSTLSGGQKQRVLIARALYRRPRLLVMDEGTAHLDSGHENAINRAIAGMGITRIIVAHREETIRIAERVLILKNGKLKPRQN